MRLALTPTSPKASKYLRRLGIGALLFLSLSGLSFLGTWYFGRGVVSDLHQLDKATKADGIEIKQAVEDLRSSVRIYRWFSDNPVMKSWGVLPGLNLVYKIPHQFGLLGTAGVNALANGGETIVEEANTGALFGGSKLVSVDSAQRISKAAAQLTPRIDALLAPAQQLHNLVSSSRFLNRWASRTDRLVQTVRAGQRTVRLATKLPEMVGSEQKRRYFVALTTPAELRGFQGLVGNFAIVELSDGALSIVEVGSNLDLRTPLRLSPRVSPGYTSVFGGADFEWLNLNLSPFIDDAGAQIEDAWKAIRRDTIDGVLFLDTVGLSGLAEGSLQGLKSPGGAPLSNPYLLQEYLSRGVYFEFDDDQIGRKKYQTQLARELLTRFVASKSTLQSKSRAVIDWFVDGHIGFWDAEDTIVTSSSWRSSSSFVANDVVVSFNNIAGNKADSYLRGQVARSRSKRRSGNTRTTTFALDLTSELDGNNRSLPDYIRRRLDFGMDSSAPAASVLDVSVTISNDSSVENALINGTKTALEWTRLTSSTKTTRFQVDVNLQSPAEIRFDVVNERNAPSLFLPPLAAPWTLGSFQ